MTSHFEALILIFTALAIGCALLTTNVAAWKGFPLPAAHHRFGCIDGLRGYLALLVMVHHFSVWTMMTIHGGPWQSVPSIAIANFGVLSVMLFFMITGFLFYGKIMNGFDATNWRRLYISRAFRILPLQFIVVLIISFVSLIEQRFVVGYTWFTWPIRVVMWMTSSFSPPMFGFKESSIINAQVFWSLRYEWIFYLAVLPILALLMSSEKVRARPFLTPLGMIAAGFAMSLLHPLPHFLHSLLAFGFGIAVRQIVATNAIDWLKTPFAAIVSAGLLVLTFAYSSAPLSLSTQLVLAIFFLCVASGNSFGGLFSHRSALALGEISFGIYLLHGTILFVGFRSFGALFAPLTPTQIVFTLPLFATTIVLASIVAFLFVERLAIELGRRVINNEVHSPLRNKWPFGREKKTLQPALGLNAERDQ